MISSPLVPSFTVRTAVGFLAVLLTAASPLVHAAKPSKEELRAMKREGVADDPTAKPKKRDDSAADARPAKPTPAEAANKQLDRLREKLEVTDDTEWTVITERISRVQEIRGTLWSNQAGNRPGALPADKGKRAAGGNSTGHAERDALRMAVDDKLPDAEIKSRLTRAHEIQQQNETRLAQAQTELRAVLTIRQEAIMVMAGLLPP